jgi:hypothetical protein
MKSPDTRRAACSTATTSRAKRTSPRPRGKLQAYLSKESGTIPGTTRAAAAAGKPVTQNGFGGTDGVSTGTAPIDRLVDDAAEARRERLTNTMIQKRLRMAKAGGPPGDRTRDTVIKSHVLYH